jgi:DNA-binding HxlR family transcriptional regulator
MNPLLTKKQLRQAKSYYAHTPPPANLELDPRVETLVNELIGRVADKWTMLILELLAEKGEMRFTRIAECIGSISQKMLTQTLRQMEREGLLIRTIHPVIPPRVEYKLTKLGLSLGEAFCGVWVWAAEHLDIIEKSRRDFDAKAKKANASL